MTQSLDIDRSYLNKSTVRQGNASKERNEISLRIVNVERHGDGRGGSRMRWAHDTKQRKDMNFEPKKAEADIEISSDKMSV